MLLSVTLAAVGRTSYEGCSISGGRRSEGNDDQHGLDGTLKRYVRGQEDYVLFPRHLWTA
jgi:hypothetical protein